MVDSIELTNRAGDYRAQRASGASPHRTRERPFLQGLYLDWLPQRQHLPQATAR